MSDPFVLKATPRVMVHWKELETAKVDFQAWLARTRSAVYNRDVQDYKQDLVIGDVICRGCWPMGVTDRDGYVTFLCDKIEPLPPAITRDERKTLLAALHEVRQQRKSSVLEQAIDKLEALFTALKVL